VSKLAVFTSLFALIVMTSVCPSWSRPGDDSNNPIIFDSVTNTTLLSQEQATDFGTDFGIEVKVSVPDHHHNRDWEFRTIIATWEEDRAIFGNNLASSFFPDPQDPTTVFVPPQAVTYDFESDYFSFELMRKQAIRPGLTFSAGPRFISTSDEIAIVATVTGSQFNDFEAKNSLVGLQVGLEVNRPIAQSLYFTVFGRAGGYYNGTRFDTATSTMDTLGITNTPVTQTRQTRSTESFVAEAGGRLNFEILPNSLSTFIGYEATVIDGIALSQANVGNVANIFPIDTNNTVFFQAITFGANLSY